MERDRRELFEELHLALEGAVDQLVRAQRLVGAGAGPKGGGEGEGEGEGKNLSERVDRQLAETVALRNDVREALMRELARGPKKLPTL